MFGGSYLGATQFLAATRGTEHLKAIMPSVAPCDLYAFVWMGGIYRDDFIDSWHALTVNLDTNGQVAPVDGPGGAELLRQAIDQHGDNWNTREIFQNPWRDSEYRESHPYLDSSAFHHIDAIEDSGVAIYHIGGWLDCFPRDAFVSLNNFENPQRLIMGPWFHGRRGEADLVGEHLRWFDYWLKGIDTGIAAEPPIHYYVMGAPEGERWQSAWTWPLPEEQPTTFYFASADGDFGELATTLPEEDVVFFGVDATATTGTGNRWTNGYGGPIGYPDMASNDDKGFWFQTAPLQEEVEVTGHPVVRLWASSTDHDGDFYVYLEEVDADGKSNYVTEGCLRASHRLTQPAPFDSMGLPFHRGNEGDTTVGFPEDEFVELAFDLQPTSNLFDAGHRIRVSITCADEDNALNHVSEPGTEVTLLLGGERPCSIVLPIIPVSTEPAAAEESAAPAADELLDVSARLEEIREESGLPALVAVAVRNGELLASGASGVRAIGREDPVRVDDPFHLGSCSKAMTSTVVASLIEQGDLGWDLSVESAFPDLAAELHPGYLGVTIEQLLSHRGGIAERTDPKVSELLRQILEIPGSPREQRRGFVRTVMSRKPTRQPGTSTEYSNFGYMIAAAMVEEISDRSFEELIVEELFEPLKMKSAGVGSPPGDDHPVGHQREGDAYVALPPGPDGILPSSMTPAGLLHCNLTDWAIFVSEHLAGQNGVDGLISAESYQRLHTPVDGASYVCGWGVAERSWAKGMTFTHNGSDGTWYSVVWAAPEIDLVLLAVVNGVSTEGNPCDLAIQALLEALSLL